MKPVMLIAALLGGYALQANAVECGSIANRAGCVGPNGAAEFNRNTGQAGTYNRNTGQGHTTQPYQYNRVEPGTQVSGPSGRAAERQSGRAAERQSGRAAERQSGRAAKALQPGCAYVNGQRVCN